jgi:hypothetical protein
MEVLSCQDLFPQIAGKLTVVSQYRTQCCVARDIARLLVALCKKDTYSWATSKEVGVQPQLSYVNVSNDSGRLC